MPRKVLIAAVTQNIFFCIFYPVDEVTDISTNICSMISTSVHIELVSNHMQE